MTQLGALAQPRQQIVIRSFEVAMQVKRLNSYFPDDYRDARHRFLELSREAGGHLEEFRNPAQAPDGNPVFTDVAWHGPRDARAVLVTLSATHGIEGFCGSGAQHAWLVQDRMPQDVALLQIHAINPHGFAWLRRVTEGNVDLNRNFLDHASAYPVNEGFEELFPYLCPRSWDEETVAECDRVIEDYGRRHGTHALQRAISGGQYAHPDGIFFGGHARTWSAETLETILTRALADARKVVLVDLHTGLGPYGYGERIVVHDPQGPAFGWAQDIWDDDIASPRLGTSVATELSGVNLTAIETWLAHTRLVACALEFGTVETQQVRRALRADNWLHMHAPEGTLGTAKGREIKRQIRDAFYPDADDWRQMVVERTTETLDAAAAWLSDSGALS